MSKNTKEARLSFRITDDLSDSIDKIVKGNSKVKDRSDFGTRAIRYYITYLKEEMDLNDKMKEAILSLAQSVNANELEEIQKLRDLVEKGPH